MRKLGWLVWLVALGCGDDASAPFDAGVDVGSAFDTGLEDAPRIPPRADYFSEGPFPVGNVRFALRDEGRERSLPVEVWYPADESAREAFESGQPIASFETEAPRSERWAGLLADAPDCVRRQTRSAAAPPAEPSGELWPLVVFSHCHSCTRFDVATVAEHLAGFGVAVVAPDHEGNTLWDELEGTSAEVGEAFLEVRVADVRFVLDRALAGDDGLPAMVRGRFDADRVGVMGHSFGAATAGIAAGRDPRFRAGFAMAAPLTALGGGVRIADLTTPFFFLIAEEDNSIGELGNNLMRSEHRRIGAEESVRVDLADAGHWNFSEYPGVIDAFAPGCGMGERQTTLGEPFTYLDPGLARDIVGDLAVAWFAAHLLDDPGALTPILEGHPSGRTTVFTR